MANKIFGADFVDETNPSGDETISINNGTNLKDVILKALLALVTHNQSSKTTPVDADEIALVDSAAGNALKKLTWANLKATIASSFGAMIATMTTKATPVDADIIAIADSAASNASKGLTWANLKATLKTYLDTLYFPFTDPVIFGLKMVWNSSSSITVTTGKCTAQNGDIINVTSDITNAGLSLSNNTTYHLYVYLSAGTPTLEIVTTAPVLWKGTAYSKTADTSRRYIGSIRSNGSGGVYSFVHNLPTNFILYQNDQGSSPFRVLSAGLATTETNVSCSAVIPPTARTAQTHITNADTAGGGRFAAIGNSGDGITLSASVAIVLVGSAKDAYHIIPLDSSQQFSYLVSASTANGVYIDVYGYFFER